MCDYGTGFVPPEMVKPRRVVVISPKWLNNRGICTVVPISTTPPTPELSIHIRFEAGKYVFFSDKKPCWAKCDMQSAVSMKRLDRIRIGHRFYAPTILPVDLTRIRNALLQVIGHHN